MYSIASQICRMKIEHAFSVRIYLSSRTRSNSSPPEILQIVNCDYAANTRGSLNSQLQHDPHGLVELDGFVKLNDFGVLQTVHHFDLAFDIFAFFSIWHRDLFRR